jgi:hypothetical protein
MTYTPEEVQQLVLNNATIIVQAIKNANEAGYPVSTVCVELLNEVPDLNTRPDLVTVLLYNGGYKLIDIVRFFADGYSEDPVNILYILQTAGFNSEQINYAMSNLGGPYAQLALSSFSDLTPQNAFRVADTAINQAEKIPVVGKPIAYVANQSLQNAKKAVSSVLRAFRKLF